MKKVKQYQLLLDLGGDVFLAIDSSGNKRILAFQTPTNETERRELLARGEDAVKISEHPNLLRIFDVGIADNGDIFLVYEQVDFVSLQAAERYLHRNTEAVTEIIRCALRVLQHLHSLGFRAGVIPLTRIALTSDGRVCLDPSIARKQDHAVSDDLFYLAAIL